MVEPVRFLFEGPTPPLTAAEALDFGDLAAIASDILGRLVRREPIDDDELRKMLVNRGVLASVIELQIGLFRASRAGEFSGVDPTLSKLLGRPTQQIGDLMRQRFLT